MKRLTSRHAVPGTLMLLSLAVFGLLADRLLLPAQAADAPKAAPTQFGEINVERINIVDRNGAKRMVISNADAFPDPVVRGKVYPRSIKTTAGLIMYDVDGNEAGGLVTAKTANGASMVATIHDYGHQPTDGIGMVKFENADGKGYSAGFAIADRLPYEPGEIKTSGGVSRIWLANESQHAKLEFNGTDGKPRLRIGVTADNQPHFEVLDADGKVVHRVPLQPQISSR